MLERTSRHLLDLYSVSRVLADPAAEVGDAGVDGWGAGGTTWAAPAGQTHQSVSAHQRAATVALQTAMMGVSILLKKKLIPTSDLI